MVGNVGKSNYMRWAFAAESAFKKIKVLHESSVPPPSSSSVSPIDPSSITSSSSASPGRSVQTSNKFHQMFRENPPTKAPTQRVNLNMKIQSKSGDPDAILQSTSSFVQ